MRSKAYVLRFTSMERFFAFIERLRRYPEAARRQILWLSVALIGAAIAAVWIAVLGWQFRSVRADAAQVPQVGEILPGPVESFRNQQRALTDELREVLRGFLLDNSPESGDTEQAQGETEDAGETSPAAPGVDLPRLPTRR